MIRCGMNNCGVDDRPVDTCPVCKRVYCEPHMENHFCSATGTRFILIDEIGSISQLKRDLNQSELDSCTRGELTILRVVNGVVQEMDSMNQSEWFDLNERG